MITDYVGFPKKGIIFRDFGPILREPKALMFMTSEFGKHFDNMKQIDVMAGIESRGFITSTLLGATFNKGVIMIRKPGKLPGNTIKRSYELEYGQSELELQTNIISNGQRVLICDDLLATGGTAEAAGKLVESAGGIVAGYAFIIELTGLSGAKVISEYKYKSLIQY